MRFRGLRSLSSLGQRGPVGEVHLGLRLDAGPQARQGEAPDLVGQGWMQALGLLLQATSLANLLAPVGLEAVAPLDPLPHRAGAPLGPRAGVLEPEMVPELRQACWGPR